MFKLNLDLWLIIPIILLELLGLLVLRSVAPGLLIYQVLFSFISLATIIFISSLDYQIIFSFYKIIYIFSILFLLLPYIFGTITRGSLRWIPIGQFSLQPSEIIKPLLLIVFSALITSTLAKKYLFFLASIIPPILIIFLQPDLGTSLVILCAWLIIFLSKIPFKHIILIGIISSIIILPVYKYGLHDYQRQCLQTFINPYRDPLGNGYHVIQSTIAVGSGGFWGRGLGHGTQSQLRFLPEHHTDFIFASLSEELGFIGASIVIAILLILLWRVYHISQQVRDPAASIFCLSAAVMLSFQIFVNIGMNIGIMPITGITLPFLSYGGSSLLSLGIIFGIIGGISSQLRNNQYLLIG